MQADTWRITGGGFHFGERGMGQEATLAAFPSDSLFAALVARLAESEGQAAVDEFMAPFLAGDPPFVLSSTFPFAGGVRFFPAPLEGVQPGQGAPAPLQDASQPEAKALKRVAYVSEGLYRRLLDGEPLAALYPAAVPLQNKKCLVSSGEQAALPKDLPAPGGRLWELEQRPRVSVDRQNARSALYFTGRVAYAPGCGLWFAVRWLTQEQGWRARLKNLLALLADSGLGAERSAGFGACRIEPGEALSLPDPNGGLWTSLSRYLPQPDETSALLHPGAAYQLRRVGGWVSSPAGLGQRRRSLNLLAEGARLGPLPRTVPGQVADVRPAYPGNPDPLGHPVYRSGLALAVGLKGGGS